MKSLKPEEITKYIEENISLYHKKSIEKINSLSFKELIKSKNPYLLKAKNFLTIEQIVRDITNDVVFFCEDDNWDKFLEGLAIFINKEVYGGWKSGITGIDLEFDNDNIRYIVSIKSGPNWGNSGQIKKMETDFKIAQKTLRTSNSDIIIKAVNGCCYGRCNKTDKGNYFKYCGQNFWKFISGNENLYTEIIEPLGYLAKEKNEEFIESYSNMINAFTKEFANEFCMSSGEIDWKKLVIFNSATN